MCGVSHSLLCDRVPVHYVCVSCPANLRIVGYGLEVWSGDVSGAVRVWNPAALQEASAAPKGLVQKDAEGLSAMCQVERHVWMATRKTIIIYDIAVCGGIDRSIVCVVCGVCVCMCVGRVSLRTQSSQVVKTVSCDSPITKLIYVPRSTVWAASSATTLPVLNLQVRRSSHDSGV